MKKQVVKEKPDIIAFYNRTKIGIDLVDKNNVKMAM
jgi:hypothetical protein